VLPRLAGVATWAGRVVGPANPMEPGLLRSSFRAIPGVSGEAVAVPVGPPYPEPWPSA